MVTYTNNDSLGIVEVNYEGSVKIGDIAGIIKTVIYKNRNIAKDLRILSDLRNAEYTFLVVEFSEVVKTLEKNLPCFNSVRVAVIHTNPKETAFSIYYESLLKLENYQHRIFNTTKSAIDWLLFEKDVRYARD